MFSLLERRQIIQLEDKMIVFRNIAFLILLIFSIPTFGDTENLSNNLSVKALKQSETDLELAILLSQQSVVADPKNAKAWAIAGKIYLLNKDLSSAERFYEKAKSIDSSLEDVKELESLINSEKKEE